MNKLLSVENLSVYLPGDTGHRKPVDSVSFSIAPGEAFSLIGESGCGKSITALSIARLIPDDFKIGKDSKILMNGVDILSLPEYKMKAIRKNDIGFIFQDPMSSLNPVLKIRHQLQESSPKHLSQDEMVELLDWVMLPRQEAILNSYPHQLSGGMKQRVMIAMALAKKPKLLIADEPTTALDVTTQSQIISILNKIKTELQTAILFITHDLALVKNFSDHLSIMYAGQIIESAPSDAFFSIPSHPYSQMLLNALPEKTPSKQKIPTIKGNVPPVGTAYPGCRLYGRCPLEQDICKNQVPVLTSSEHQVRCHFYPSNSEVVLQNENISDMSYSSEESDKLIETKGLKVYFSSSGFFKKRSSYVKAVEGVDIEVYEDETVALVGESGSGKTTVGKAIIRLIDPTGGTIKFMGRSIEAMSEKQLRIGRSHFQMIFQDPMSSLNPKLTIKEILEEGMISLKVGTNKAERLDRAINLLEQVGLDASSIDKYPHQFSGGQKQRICIARALSVAPRFIVCDEPTSALDVSVQAQILNLLQKLQNEYGIGYLFITHNINVVKHFADRVYVMKNGVIVEKGVVREVLNNPQHEYTKKLIRSVPQL
ncbi:MAG: ABC transporter ATP-binding protein [Legionellales bacterium]|nr:ABC transporter ATP-binding protein [Legionellales bacterium]